jgi:Sigma-70, region 4.
MAIVVEVQQIGDLFRIVSHQIVESDDNPEFEALQRVADESAAEAFRMIEVRDTLRVLLERTQLEQRESEVVALFLLGWDFPEIAQQIGVSRQFVQATFKRAVAKLRKTAKALGINEP